ncbi:autotransporter outer membrane beta-barrel domain-containing protein, partial [Turicimonas muris]
ITFAYSSIIDESLNSEKSIVIDFLDKTIEDSDRYVGIGANSGTVKITAPEIKIQSNQKELSDVQRIYGIASEPSASIVISAPVIIETVTTNAQNRVLRANGGNLSINGTFNLLAQSSNGFLSALDVWNDSIVRLDGPSLTFNLSSENATISGIKVASGEVKFEGEELELRAKSLSGRVVGVENYKSDGNGGEINFNSVNTSIYTDNSSSTGQYNQGVLAYQSTTNFNGDALISVKGGTNVTYGVDIQCDPGLPFDTIVNFNGASTTVVTTGKGQAIALRPSGTTGYLNIFSEQVNISAESTKKAAMGIEIQYGASLKIENENAVVNVSAVSTEDKAYAILDHTYGGNNSVQLGSIDVIAKVFNAHSEGASAYGVAQSISPGATVHIVDEKDGIRINATATINTVSTASDGISVGISSDNTQNGSLAPKGVVSISEAVVNSVAKNGGSAVAVHLQNQGYITLGSSTLNAFSEDGKAVGIYNDNSTLNLDGNTLVTAETALAGSGGTINVGKDATVILNGTIDKDKWSGTLSINGKLAYGLSPSESSDLDMRSNGTLLLPAGTELAGNVIVGDTTRKASLTIADGSTVLIKATDDFDGSSPLVVTDSVNAGNGSKVVLLNSVKVADGTPVFSVKGPSLEDYVFLTDNLLKKVVDNQVVTQKATEVFGSLVLIPNLVDAALSSEGEGAGRLAELSNGTDVESVTSSLNKIALMGAAAGAQTIALNASNMLLQTLDEHGSKLAAYDHKEPGADLWINIDGFFSKASDYSAGSTNYGYKSDLTGVTLGGDYAFGNGWAVGLAASFGDGSLRGQGNGSGIKNDVRYYGVNVYGVWSNEYFNTIGSMGYLQSKNKIKSQGFEGKPDTKTFALGVRFEKPLTLNESIAVTPHIGFRYKHVKTDSFNAGGFSYKYEKANLFEVPFGVAFNGNLKASCGANIKPFVDLEISPNLGDRKVKNTVGLAGSG